MGKKHIDQDAHINKPASQMCTILAKSEAILPNKHCDSVINGYIILDQSKKNLGIVAIDNKYGDQRAVIRYRNEYEDLYGTWHKISSHGNKISIIEIYNKLVEALKNGNDSIDIWVD